MSITGAGSGNTYTPGTVQHLTVTVPTTTQSKGFEFTARLASNTGTTEGTIQLTDTTNTKFTGTGSVFITHTSTGNSNNAFHFDWTPPSTNVGDIVFYAAGVSGFPNVYRTSLTLTPVAGTPVPTLSANPTGPLNFSYQTGGSLPAAQTFTVSSSNGSPVAFSAAATSTGGWLSVSPLNGTTGSSGTLTVAVAPTSLGAGSASGTVTVTSPGASNTLSVKVNLTVTTSTPPPTTLSVSRTSLTFSGHSFLKPQMVHVTSNGAAIPFMVNVHMTAGDPGWLSASCSGDCATPEDVSVTVGSAGGAPGTTYTGSVTFTPTDTTIPGQTVAVTATVPRQKGGGGGHHGGTGSDDDPTPTPGNGHGRDH